MYWNGMQNTIWKYVKNCHHTCQVNKWHKHKYVKLLPKLVIQKPWEALCVDSIGPYTFKGQDETEIDVLYLTMIDPATSWLKIIELLVVEESAIPSGTGGFKGSSAHSTPKVPCLTNHLSLLAPW
jgi:hypothetical protein